MQAIGNVTDWRPRRGAECVLTRNVSSGEKKLSPPSPRLHEETLSFVQIVEGATGEAERADCGLRPSWLRQSRGVSIDLH